MFGCVVEGARGTVEHDTPVIEADDAVGERAGERDLVQDQNERDAVADGQRAEILAEAARQRLIERGKRLVAEQEPGPARERAGDADALALAAGKIFDALEGAVEQADIRKGFGRRVARGKAARATGRADGAPRRRPSSTLSSALRRPIRAWS